MGYGEDRPIDSNGTREGRQANRRVQFIITEKDGQPTGQ
jgi:flagellar motor protein MotB